MNIYVTKDDIKFGKRGTCAECPVALAVNRRLKEGYFATVGARTVTIRIHGTLKVAQTLHLGKKVQDFITDFDWCCSPKPLRFSLDVKEDYCG
jgi:hypothetical protein